jgi:hypothetical protein
LYDQKKTPKTKATLSRKNKPGAITLPDFKTNNKFLDEN